MSAILSAVLKVTIGLIVDKVRDVAAENMRESDVTDEKLRRLIVGELIEIHNKLDALSQKDLKAAVDFFETGLESLYAMPSGDSTKELLLSGAQKKFKLAVENATHAWNNEALGTLERITAIRYRLMAAMLQSAAETARTTGDLKSTLQKALPECEQCLKKLNSLPAVQKSFAVGLSKGFLNLIRSQFGKDERVQIISTVCQVNRAVYDAVQTVGKDVHVLVWPYVDIGEDQVDPLGDVRVLQVLEKSEKVDMEHYRITPGRSFDVTSRILGIATNTLGQFLITVEMGKTVHVYDDNGMFQFSFNPQTDDAKTEITIADLVTEDVSEKIYLLIGLYNEERCDEVQVLNKTAHLQYKFPVKYGRRLIVSGSKLVILTFRRAYVYNQNGDLERSFEFFKSGGDKCLADCTATYDGRILIRHYKGDFSNYFCVHVFTMEGQEIAKFKSGVGLNLDYMLFSPRSAGEHVVIADYNEEDGIITVELYTVDGKLVRRILLREEPELSFSAITVTLEGQIAVCFRLDGSNIKVVVFKN